MFYLLLMKLFVLVCSSRRISLQNCVVPRRLDVIVEICIGTIPEISFVLICYYFFNGFFEFAPILEINGKYIQFVFLLEVPK